jgi:hypothetical protein
MLHLAEVLGNKTAMLPCRPPVLITTSDRQCIMAFDGFKLVDILKVSFCDVVIDILFGFSS